MNDVAAAASETEEVLWIDPKGIPLMPNPRKKLGDISELTASVIENGVQTPCIARRRVSGAMQVLELVTGQRRRAAAIAGGKELPIIVRDLNDDEALDVQLVENLDRADLDPLDEAAVYQGKLERGQSPRQIADRIGRGIGYVVKRLKLLELGKETKAALAEGTITVSVAEMIGRLPGKLQAKALQDLTWERGVTTAEASDKLREKYMLRLDAAPFDTGDPDLVKKAGACSICPHRTGNQAELFSDVGSPDLCTRPPCFEEKTRVHGARALAAAKKAGTAVLSKTDEKAVFGGSYSAKFERLDREEYVSPMSSKRMTIRKMLDKAGIKPTLTVAADPKTGAIVELVPKAEADKARRKLRGEKTSKATKKRGASAKDKAERTISKLKVEAREELRGRVCAAIAEAGPVLDDAVLALLRHHYFDMASEVLKRRGLERPKKFAGAKWEEGALGDLGEKLEPEGELGGLLAELLVAELEDGCYRPEQEKALDQLCNGFFGVDRAKIRRELLAELDEKTKAAKVAAKAKPAAKPKAKPKGAAKDALCQVCGWTGKSAHRCSKTAKKKARRKS